MPANHHVIHDLVINALKAESLFQVENHHNFAWKETHDGEELIVHRKGATPAGKNVLGIIPGSMASPAYVVKGKGKPESLNSAAHGAGRVMSRKRAHRELNWEDANKILASKGVTLLSAGLDEVPTVYKNIDKVMEEQQDLVDIQARFDPKLVKMAPLIYKYVSWRQSSAAKEIRFRTCCFRNKTETLEIVGENLKQNQ